MPINWNPSNDLKNFFTGLCNLNRERRAIIFPEKQAVEENLRPGLFVMCLTSVYEGRVIGVRHGKVIRERWTWLMGKRVRCRATRAGSPRAFLMTLDLVVFFKGNFAATGFLLWPSAEGNLINAPMAAENCPAHDRRHGDVMSPFHEILKT